MASTSKVKEMVLSKPPCPSSVGSAPAPAGRRHRVSERMFRFAARGQSSPTFARNNDDGDYQESRSSAARFNLRTVIDRQHDAICLQWDRVSRLYTAQSRVPRSVAEGKQQSR